MTPAERRAAWLLIEAATLIHGGSAVPIARCQWEACDAVGASLPVSLVVADGDELAEGARKIAATAALVEEHTRPKVREGTP